MFEGNPLQKNCSYGKNYLINEDGFSNPCRINNVDWTLPDFSFIIPEKDKRIYIDSLLPLIRSNPFNGILSIID